MGNQKECEVCGRDAYSLVRREIEGVIMLVCSDCQDLGDIPKVDIRAQKRVSQTQQRTEKFRSIVSTPESPKIPDSPYKKKQSRPKQDKFSKFKVVDNAPELLLKFRTTTGLSSKDLANSVLIKENYYKRIEKGTTSLSLDLARKIEQKHHLTLVEQEDYDEEDDYSQFLKNNKSTGESMIYFKKKGQKPEYD